MIRPAAIRRPVEAATSFLDERWLASGGLIVPLDRAAHLSRGGEDLAPTQRVTARAGGIGRPSFGPGRPQRLILHVGSAWFGMRTGANKIRRTADIAMGSSSQNYPCTRLPGEAEQRSRASGPSPRSPVLRRGSARNGSSRRSR